MNFYQKEYLVPLQREQDQRHSNMDSLVNTSHNKELEQRLNKLEIQLQESTDRKAEDDIEEVTQMSLLIEGLNTQQMGENLVLSTHSMQTGERQGHSQQVSTKNAH